METKIKVVYARLDPVAASAWARAVKKCREKYPGLKMVRIVHEIALAALSHWRKMP